MLGSNSINEIDLHYTNADDCMDELPKGYVLNNRYEIVSTLGAGGMGSVYLARDQVLVDEVVALKVLHADFARDEQHQQRFLREVQLMRRVNHPNVVRTYDVGVAEGYVYFSMEYVPGRPLSDLMDDGFDNMEFVPELIIQVSEGLTAIHEADIVHRDLKPGNLMILENGGVKITDFGVARPASSDLTAHNEIIGSVHYMAPEVWLGKSITGAADFYGLGIILYELVTGKVPFQHERPATLMWMHVKSEPAPPMQVNPNVPQWLNRLILRLMAKSPLERPADVKEIRNVVDFYASQQSAALSGSVVTVSAANFASSISPSIQRRDSGFGGGSRGRTVLRRVRGERMVDLNPISSIIVGIWSLLLASALVFLF